MSWRTSTPHQSPLRQRRRSAPRQAHARPSCGPTPRRRREQPTSFRPRPRRLASALACSHAIGKRALPIGRRSSEAEGSPGHDRLCACRAQAAPRTASPRARGRSDHTFGGYPATVPSLHSGWRNAVGRLEKYGHAQIRAGAALFLLAACTIGFISVPILVAVSGAERRGDYGAAVGGVIGAVFCIGMALWMLSPRRDERDKRDERGAGVLRFMDGRRWRALRVVSGAALAGLGVLEVQRGNSEGWLMMATLWSSSSPPKACSTSLAVVVTRRQ